MDGSITNANELAYKEQSCLAQDAGSENESVQTGTSGSSSSASSPMPVEDLGPVFEVKGIRATTDSSVLTFRISRLDDPENRDSWWEVTRSAEEFEAFNRLILDCQKFGGMIFPPLPPPVESKYEESFLEAPIIHRKQVERYLQLVSSHPILGRSQALADFLSPTYVMAEKSGRKGFFSKIAESFSGSSQPAKVPHRDIEEFFQNERDWSANYSVHLKTTLNAVLTVIYSEKKIIGQLKHLCTALSMNAPSCYQQETGLIHHRLHSKMADSFLNIQDLTEDGLQRGLCDFYCIWDLYLQYLANEQLMLNRRTALLINYENCNRNWDKAKAHKRDEWAPLMAHEHYAIAQNERKNARRLARRIPRTPPFRAEERNHRVSGMEPTTTADADAVAI
ncbi:hypothetical protein DAPPUDRAFT_240424 [Daphnia pulex]|uniref:PX domain-containing protein n=1 Tax=Daphnia pulex TaxID=6669 RepID=E9GBI4_DAPPU|nr:hypothetical protein DAPPUDRAFT_240424 [Daphnia pulex]|eukprot:EFX83147.1 hypothetical protein DAPPUDRAFT_240424 [Daphnia pulex]